MNTSVPAEPERASSLIDTVANWLVSQALIDTPIEALFEKTCIRLHAAGIPISRSQVGFRVLHPLFDAQTITWKLNQEVERADYMTSHNPKPWQRSPLYYMVVNSLPHLRRRLVGDENMVDFDVLHTLKDDGYTDYLGFMVPFSEQVADKDHENVQNSGIVGSWSTTRPNGFSDGDIRALQRIEQRLAVAFKINIQSQITQNILSAYLGPDAGKQVLNGNIRRGDGETIHAVIWYSDMRESTSLADTMSGKEFLQALNEYFESTAGAVLSHGGEVLRFIGDAVLAIFPIRGDDETRKACECAISAAILARENLTQANISRRDNGLAELDFGLGLHIGEVLFGNIGTPERVEFSVIGRAANEVARIESLTKELKENILVSSDFAQHIPLDWVNAGDHNLRGLDRTLTVFTPPKTA